jgi:SAM-dependent methyltransferase
VRSEAWNHNIHYHDLLLSMVPAGCQRALDVGCGDGLFTRELALRVPSVIGIDRSAEMENQAWRLTPLGSGVDYVCGDFLSYPLEGTFGFISAIASIHHMDFHAGVARMRELLGPGGVVAVLGLAKDRTTLDFAYSALGFSLAQVMRIRHSSWAPGAPITEPSMSYGEVRRASQVELPGSRFRRLLLFRYSLVWQKPSS